MSPSFGELFGVELCALFGVLCGHYERSGWWLEHWGYSRSLAVGEKNECAILRWHCRESEQG
jgi:hypothetical protein